MQMAGMYKGYIPAICIFTCYIQESILRKSPALLNSSSR